MKVYLVRHGETTGDIENRYGGNYDDHLTERGREQLSETAEKLSDKNIEIIFTSSLIRAQESAEIISEKTQCPIEIIPSIQERNYGILAGLTKEEALEKYPDAAEAHKNPQNTDPEGESKEDFEARVLKGFNEIFSTKHNTIAIVSHGGPLKCLFRSKNMTVPEKIEDGEIFEITI